MTHRDKLERLTKGALLEMARRRGVVGRSRMRKAELIEALVDESPAGESPAGATPSGDVVRVRTLGSVTGDRAAADESSSMRRQRLAERHADFFEPGRICRWQSIEGHPCGLPCIRDTHRCGLHGGIDIVDRAVPVAGHLGFDTWPRLVRHLALATYDIDPLGLDPVVAEMVWHLVNYLYYDWFRVEVEAAGNIPATGGAVVVANHGGGALPYDAFMLSAAISNEASVPRRLRVVGTEVFGMLPWVSHMYRKAGGTYASRGDADHLLARGRLLGVFPEGERGFMKPVWEAYQVQRLGRGGFVDLAETHGVPIVPTAIVGAEEVHPVVGVSETLARIVRLILPQQRVDKVAIVTNPVPLPVRFHIRFLEPVEPAGIAVDPLAVLERTESIQASIQSALDDMVRNRRSPF